MTVGDEGPTTLSGLSQLRKTQPDSSEKRFGDGGFLIVKPPGLEGSWRWRRTDATTTCASGATTPAV